MGYALAFLLWASTAWAVAPTLMSSFDVVDHLDSTTTTDVLDFATIETATDADVRAAQCTANSYRCRLDTNGGSSSSRFAGNLDLASGERGGWEQNAFVGIGAIEGTIAFAVHWGSGLGVSGDRELARWTMGAGGTQGCNVRLTSSRTFTLYYASTLIGTSEGTLQTNACSDNAQRGCASGADCVSTTCSTCSTTTGAGCYWPTVELVQVNLPSGTGDNVQCQLWIQGTLEVDSGNIAAAGLDTLTGFEIGGPGTEAATLQLAVDDVVVIPAARAGNSYLHWMTPSIGTVIGGAVESTCGSGSTVQKCVGDWGESGLNYRNFGTGVDDTIRTGVVGRGFEVTRFTPQPSSVPDGATIPAVATPVVGRTGTGSSWVTRTALAQCATMGDPCGSVASPVDMDHDEQTTPILTGFPVTDAPPAGGGAWSLAQLATLGTLWQAQAVSGGNSLRAGAIGAVVQVRRPDSEPVANLVDHNIGTDDGVVTVSAQGDSTGAGTGASTCQGGTSAGQTCNQTTYCSWDSTNKSKPVGGCSSNTECRTCTARRLEFNRGAGYACTADASCDLGTCSAGACTGDSDITCTINADCQLGTCATTATCEDSCPGGGSCPARAGWPAYAQFVSDNYLNCSQDGNTTSIVAQNYLPAALYGRGSTCKLIWGDPGKCTCSSNSECQATSGGTCTKTGGNGRCSSTLSTTCTSDGDCPGGETCLGLCTASDNGRNACTGPTVTGTSTAQCASTRVCAFAPADYFVIGTGPNDMNTSDDTAECKRPYTATKVCDACTETACVADSTCSGISASSQCFGALGTAAAGTGCWGPQVAEYGCSTDSRSCRLDSECRTGQFCSGESGGPEPDGYCACDADGDCLNNASGDGVGYKCVNSVCRLKCSTNAHCGATSGVCDGGTTSCMGQCSCPCDHTSCSVDGDCPTWSESVFGFFPNRTATGKCVAGKCAQCSWTRCASSAAPRAYRQNYFRWHGGTYWSQQVRAMNARILYEAAYTSDSTVPLVIPMTFPNGTASINPACTGSYWGGLYDAAPRARKQLRSEFRHVIDAGAAVDAVPDNAIYVDMIHPGAYGASVWGAPMGDYLKTLNSCRTGTRADSVLAKYCKNLDGTWDTGGAGYTVCAANADCSGTDTCVQRTCTVDDDTSSGCPGAPTCNLE